MFLMIDGNMGGGGNVYANCGAHLDYGRILCEKCGATLKEVAPLVEPLPQTDIDTREAKLGGENRHKKPAFDGHRLTITETIYRGKLRGYGKTKGSLTTVDLPEELANQIGAWLETLEDKGPTAFLFPNADGGFILKDNYLHRVLYPLRKQLGLLKLNFQILRRTFSTLAQRHGTVKDVQRQMRHAKPDLTAEVYMQAIPESVQRMVADMYTQLLKPATETVQ